MNNDTKNDFFSQGFLFLSPVNSDFKLEQEKAVKCGTKQTMSENILFNFLMCPYVSYVINFIYNYKQRILNHIRYIRAISFVFIK